MGMEDAQHPVGSGTNDLSLTVLVEGSVCTILQAMGQPEVQRS